jgi:hypothetical protein
MGSTRKEAAMQTKVLAQTIDQRFEAFHARHPEVWDLFVRFSLEIHDAGQRKQALSRYGIAAITERIRWHYAVRPDIYEPFRINNDFRARYARRLMREYPQLTGMFHIRTLRAE